LSQILLSIDQSKIKMELNLHKIDFDFLVQQKGMNGCIETREGKCLNRTVADQIN
jgi:hypothetical protein